MLLLTTSPVTGLSAPMLEAEDTLREWGYLSVEGSETAISMSHHRSEEVSREGPQPRPIAAFYHVAVPLRASTGTLFRDGRYHAALAMAAGGVRLRDCEEAWAVEMHEPFQGVEFWMSKTDLDELTYQEQRPPGSLSGPPERPAFDAVMLGLAQALLPSVRLPDEADALFVSSLLLAVRLHSLKTFGCATAPPKSGAARLAKWQEVRAEDLIMARLAADLSIEELASACGLSPAHFARAFKNSTGLAPHQWRTRCRIAKVKALLEPRAAASLGQIAAECGFSDQSHMTKVFGKATGLTPGAWKLRAD